MRDDKVLADWNGMTIAALANAGAVFRNTEWTMAAMRAFDFVERALGDGDRLYHSWRNGKRQHTGFADDYAQMARAAFALWEATSDKRYLDRAQAWVRVLNEHFWDVQNGGYFHTSDDSDPLDRPLTDDFRSGRAVRQWRDGLGAGAHALQPGNPLSRPLQCAGRGVLR